MIEIVKNFFTMHGYGTYIFSAYGIVLFYLLIQWFIPWRSLQNYLRTQKNK